MEKTVCFRDFEERDIDFIYKCKMIQVPFRHDCYKESGDNISIKGASEIIEIIKDAIKSQGDER